MATAAEFYSSYTERKRDGEFLSSLEVTAFEGKKLLGGVSSHQCSLILTTAALYEFKTVAVRGPEKKRYEIESVRAVITSFEFSSRFTVGFLDNSSRTYESPLRDSFVKRLAQACDAITEGTTGKRLPLRELPERHRLGLVADVKRSRESDGWTRLIGGDQSTVTPLSAGITPPVVGANGVAPVPLVASHPGSAEPSPPGSAGLAPASSPQGGEVVSQFIVGGYGSLGPMTLVWKKLEHSIMPFFTIASLRDNDVIALTNTLSETIGVPNDFPFTATGAPKSAPDAARALASVCLDLKRAATLMRVLDKSAQRFVVSVETLLGCSDEVVRRWSSVCITSALPVINASNSVPDSDVWDKALKSFARQSPRRDNAILGVMFSASLATPSFQANLEGLAPASSRESDLGLVNSTSGSGGKRRPPALGAIGKSKMTVNDSNTSNTSSLGNASIGGSDRRSANRRPTNNSLASFGSQLSSSTTGGGDSASASGAEDSAVPIHPKEASDRRLRGAFGLLWATRLLDLEAGLGANDAGGVTNLDVQTIIQLCIGRRPDPLVETSYMENFAVETFGAVMEYPELLPTLAAALTATRRDELRRDGLKQLNVLVMRNAPSTAALLGVPDWQSVLLPILYNVPLDPKKRTPVQDESFNFLMHLMTTLHVQVLGSPSALKEYGPLDSLLAQTLFKIAVYGGWNESAIGVARLLLKGILTMLSKLAQNPSCRWRVDPSTDEWEELFRVMHLLQTFLFYRPPSIVEYSSKQSDQSDTERGKGGGGGGDGDDAGDGGDGSLGGEWRARISFESVLRRVTKERMVAVNRQAYARMAAPVMSASHRGEDLGIHLDESGACVDRPLVETALAMWATCGISGNPRDDHKKSEEFVNKTEKSRVLYASKLVQEYKEILHLFNSIEERRTVMGQKFRRVESKDGEETKTAAAGAAAAQTSTTTNSAASSSDSIEARQEELVEMAMSHVTDFLHSQRKNEVSVGFMSKTKSKAVATKLRANMLKQREVATTKVELPKLAPKSAETGVAPASMGRTAGKGSGYTKTETGQTIWTNEFVRNLGAVVAIRGDQDVLKPVGSKLNFPDHVHVNPEQEPPEEELSVFAMQTLENNKSDVVPSPAATRATRATLAVGRGPGDLIDSRKTLVEQRRTVHDPGRRTVVATSRASVALPPSTTAKKNNNANTSVDELKKLRATCHGCLKVIEDQGSLVSKFGFSWHPECVVCSHCDRNILTDFAPRLSDRKRTGKDDDLVEVKDEERRVLSVQDTSLLASCRYYPIPELLLCSLECREKVLNRPGDARCPSCMDGFNANEQAFRACGHSWHMDLGCFRCTSCDLRFSESEPYFENKNLPYCRKCFDVIFLQCRVCHGTLESNDVVQAADGSCFHLRCFSCAVCSAPFPGNTYYSGGGGRLLCLTHFLSTRSPPCTFCHRRFVDADDPVEIAGLAFHRHCFKCSKCDRPLKEDAAPGNDFEPHVMQGMIYCPDCYAFEFGVTCHKCNLGIRGDILHAGIGRSGEPINWHPACFNCDECSKSLVDVLFVVVTLGDDVILPLCSEHYESKYASQRCPGCDKPVKPGRNKNMPASEMVVELALDGPAVAPESFGPSIYSDDDSNPAIMYNEHIWHSKCLICDEPGCGISLYFEHNDDGHNQFVVNQVQGAKFCVKHAEVRAPKCHACGTGIFDADPREEMMGWIFHDRPTCFCCIQCKGPFFPGQPLRKRRDGPVHADCPADQSIMRRVSRAANRMTRSGRRTVTPPVATTPMDRKKSVAFDPAAPPTSR